MTRGIWRWMDHGPCNGAWNMATDEALLFSCETGQATLRLYGWRSPTISLGYSQNVERDLDRAACAERGVEVVRRATGGRAVWHHHEVTYSVVAPVTHPEFPGGLRGTFQAVSQALLCGLRELGVPDVDLNAAHRPAPGGGKSPACFAALNHCEITAQGRKLVGSAQRRTQTAFLQHGSILLQHEPEPFVRLLKFSDDSARERAHAALKSAGVGLYDVLGDSLGCSQISQVILKGFMKTFPGVWREGELDGREAARRDAILQTHSPVGIPELRV